MAGIRLRKGDEVMVITGKDRGKRGRVQEVRPGARTVIVAGVNIAKRHTKPRQRSGQSDRVPRIQQGGILDLAQPLAISNVMLVCPRCETPTRVGHVALENGKRVRVCRHCGEQLEVKTT